MYQQTSLEAYRRLADSDELNDRQKVVLLALMERGPLNNRLLAHELSWPINTVTPRVKELRDQGLVVEHSRAVDYVTGRSSIFWEVRNGVF